MNILNESALRDMMFQIVKESKPRLEEDLTAKTIGINEFRRDYCQGKSAEWVRTKIFDRYPEVVFDPVKHTGGYLTHMGKVRKQLSGRNKLPSGWKATCTTLIGVKSYDHQFTLA